MPIPIFTVQLNSCGNPDHGQSPRTALSPSSLIQVDTLEAASRQCRAYIEENSLGGGNWSGGQVFLDDKPFAYVSYNGRVWGPDVQSNSKSKRFHGNGVALG